LDALLRMFVTPSLKSHVLSATSFMILFVILTHDILMSLSLSSTACYLFLLRYFSIMFSCISSSIAWWSTFSFCHLTNRTSSLKCPFPKLRIPPCRAVLPLPCPLIVYLGSTSLPFVIFLVCISNQISYLCSIMNNVNVSSRTVTKSLIILVCTLLFHSYQTISLFLYVCKDPSSFTFFDDKTWRRNVSRNYL